MCKQGSRCRVRTFEHLIAEAHPLDRDYASCCAVAGVDAEPLSLKLVFDWADADGSGHLSKEELAASLSLILTLCKSGIGDKQNRDDADLVINEAAWQRLEQDGNGVVNFMEFASWAGPRLGLPLGFEHMIRSCSSSLITAALPCCVINCPCENFCASADGRVCTSCKHKRAGHFPREQPQEIPFPTYWNNQVGDFEELVDMGSSQLGRFQKLFDRTYLDVFTRDRRNHNPDNPNVPAGYSVKRVWRNENSSTWTKYCARRLELLMRTQEADEGLGEPWTSYTDVKTTLAWHEVKESCQITRLSEECNEWYLLHGTQPEAAKKICSSGFKVSLAGKNTGTLYGRGIYMAESITKADEYAKPASNGNYAVLLCRVLGGRVRYTDEVTPDPEELVHSCVQGPFDCVLGDREKCRGTFREFVFFDSEDVCPEYVVEYQRCLEDDASILEA